MDQGVYHFWPLVPGRVNAESVCAVHGDGRLPPEMNEAQKVLALQMVLKVADLGHLTAPLPIHKVWPSICEGPLTDNPCTCTNSDFRV